MIERCSVKDCTVVRDGAATVPQPCFSEAEWFPDRQFCYEHYKQALQVERELPLAIQEFHAWALIANPYFDDDQIQALVDAQKRVRKLRALEAFLKGA